MKKLIQNVLFICSLIFYAANLSAALPAMVAGQKLPSLAPLVDKVSPAVVNISVFGNPNNKYTLFELFNLNQENRSDTRPIMALGSGVITDAKQGYLITNYHVIEDAVEIKVTLKSGKEFIALVIGSDRQSDIALLQIKNASNLTQITFADSDKSRVGDFVIAIGNPFGLGQTVTSGIISALGRSGLNLENLENFIQTDAAINSGNSGGALLNLNGELIGINTAILGPDGGNIGIAFAIPSNMVNNLIQQLLLYGEIRRGLLGIKGQELTAELADTFALDSQHGAFIKQVNPNSAAEEAGLKAGDVIISMNGSEIHSFAELRAKVGTLRAGKTIQLEVVRNGQKVKLNATLKEAVKDKVTFIHPLLEGALLTNTKNNQGVIVSQIKEGSISLYYGLQQGDIIIGINRVQVNNLKELTALIKNSPQILALNIQRNNRLLYLILN